MKFSTQKYTSKLIVMILLTIASPTDKSFGPKGVSAGVDPVNATKFDVTIDVATNDNVARRTNRRYDEARQRNRANNDDDDDDETSRTLSFNVTHTYYRSMLTDYYSAALAVSRDNTDRRFATATTTGLLLDYDPATKRCRRRSRRVVSSSSTNLEGEFFDNRPIPFTFNYWINPYELPERISIYDSHGRIVYNLTSEDNREKLNVVARVVKQVFEEFDLPHKRVNDIIDYYESLDLLYYPRENRNVATPNRYVYDERTKTYRLQRTVLNRGEFLPIQIHFRSKPYPQSTFMEFVSDRNRVWRVYDSRFYNSYSSDEFARPQRGFNNDDDNDHIDENNVDDKTRLPGNDDDLLYRLRHNLRHSLGLGHTTSKKCVMYPTNVLGLNKPCEHEKIALHRFLCDKSLRLHEQ